MPPLDFVQPGTVGGEIATNLPHLYMAQHGTWRDWVLGMTIITAEGKVAKSGSNAVKSVAGYDVHRLMIGARGTLGVIADVILRTTPLGALRTPDADRFAARQIDSEVERSKPGFRYQALAIACHRVLARDFGAAVERNHSWLTCADRAASVLYYTIPYCAFEGQDIDASSEIQRFPGDWLIRGDSMREVGPDFGEMLPLMMRTKKIFDPNGKLNPGEMGLF
jgi:FAD/FMN-containing dehydrogenase